MNNKTLSLTVAASSLITGSAIADYTGLSVEATLYQGEIEDLAGTWTARIYANFDAETDMLTSVFGDSDDPLLIASTNGFYQNPFSGPTSTSINPALYSAFPSLVYDSWVTIGLTDQVDNAMGHIGIDWTDFETNGGDISNSNGTWFATPLEPQVLAGEDLRVLIGQFTMYETDSRVWGILNLQGKQGNFETFQARGQTFDYEFDCIADGNDCNNNGIPDLCDIKDGTSNDCNFNYVPDECDVVNGNSPDCDQNGVPDECQPDCDGDGWIDPCDNESDCDNDGIPDNCEVDCNENGVPDDCDIIFGLSQDCNENGIPDECDINNGSIDCNENGIPDECEGDGGGSDCNQNDIPDSCDIEMGTSNDCNLNGIPDECDFADGTALDCNGNGVPDSCDLHEETKLTASNGASNDQFGYSVSISGDGSTAIVGARWDDDNGTNSGSAYIYELVKGVWQQTKLTASGGPSGDNFGFSVSISSDGSTAIVGAFYDDDNGSNSGSAYIYELVKGAWQETKLIASDGEEYDQFGYSVSISSDGSTALVGACYDDDNGSYSGSAYIYRFDGSEWIEETKLLANDGEEYDEFGYSVSISSDGSTAIVGAHRNNDNGSFSGSAYIYELVGGVWEESKLLASDGASNDFFGRSVSISSDGTTAIVGARWDDDNGSYSGSAYIYRFDGSEWIEETKLLANDGEEYDEFGYSVSISGDGTSALVGAWADDDNGSNSGSAYIYELVGGVWQETKLLASDGASGDEFGLRVSISSDGTTAIVGAYADDDNGIDSGSAYIYPSPFTYYGEAEDCNANGVPDECDIDDGTSNDVNSNGIPDECEVDCNGNGVPDYWDIKTGTSQDCQPNGVPDECDIDDGTSNDENSNGVPDECDPDCNNNDIPDFLEIKDGTAPDCNGNGIPDECDIAEGDEEDCNENGVPDSCDLADNPSLDCDGDGVFDSCAINDGLVEDCNDNWIPDECDISTGELDDVNGDGVPDECQCIADTNNDGFVDINDILLVVGYWGLAIDSVDINNDGIIDVIDLILLIANWGPCE